MPRHFLRRRDLKLANAEARRLCVTSAALDLIKMARILDWFHRFLHLWARPPNAMPLSRHSKSCSKIPYSIIGSSGGLDAIVIPWGTNNVVAEPEAFVADGCILDTIEVPRSRSC